MRYLAVLFVVLISSCSVDELPACNENIPVGFKCKAYQYTSGKFNSTQSFEYNADSLLVKTSTFKSNNKLVGKTYYYYNENDKVEEIEKRNANDAWVQSEFFTYSSNGLLVEKVTNNSNLNRLIFNYQDSLLLSKVNIVNNDTLMVDSFEYYTNTHELYRTLRYRNDSLNEIRYFESFSNNTERERIFDVNGNFKGELVVSFNGQNQKNEIVSYNEFNLVDYRIVYKYQEDSIVEQLLYNGEGEVEEKIEVQRK